jgi:cytochrome c-type biogenesis protein CcmF
VGRNRGRYGGYVVHAGIAVLFLGVAASSSFVEQRDVRLAPGDRTEVAGYQIAYREATAQLGGDRDGTGAPIAFGAILDVRKDGERFTLSPTRNFYPGDPAKGPIARFFDGEATSEVDVRWGLRRDLWLAVRPDVAALGPIAERLDERLPGADAERQARAIAALAEIYRRDPPPAAFRALVSPLVAWIWIGGAIVLLGALIAAWPSPEARLRRVRSLYAARLGRELTNA